jgi:hypothetical protein
MGLVPMPRSSSDYSLEFSDWNRVRISQLLLSGTLIVHTILLDLHFGEKYKHEAPPHCNIFTHSCLQINFCVQNL